MIAPKPSGIANTKAGKDIIIDRTKQLLSTSSLVLTVPIQGVTKEQIDMLRKTFIPRTIKVSVVKNSLLRKASEGTPFAPLGEVSKKQNMFFFIPEGEAKPAYEGLKKWQREIKRTDADYAVQYAGMEGQLYDSKLVEAVVNLPTKKELITKIAIGIKAVPTKLGRAVKGVPSKLGRAFAGLRDKLEEEEKAKKS